MLRQDGALWRKRCTFVKTGRLWSFTSRLYIIWKRLPFLVRWFSRHALSFGALRLPNIRQTLLSLSQWTRSGGRASCAVSCRCRGRDCLVHILDIFILNSSRLGSTLSFCGTGWLRSR
ncbi:hypothetical protein SISSUDRAFT_511008 [Sistotremastrum suecicum HHB10207 ss-3]|uniref:Uncharacterized protein n=1 Tax=Sistotremastrum suecicum HHB10207 ss-3 TaxID=1314776 RepID=A0A166IN17_9AGAM|nr:hypothetical protein SISSUDRAFT_511008 [Sistotremastrum suecicum HHB10207 ss-3]